MSQDKLFFKGSMFNGDMPLSSTMVCVPSKPVYKDVDLALKSTGFNVAVAAITNSDLNFEEKQKLGYEIERRWNEHRDWTHVDDALPELAHESEEDHDEDGNPQWFGQVSQSLEISDGHRLARGHYRNDGTWVVYDAEHDFQLLKPEEVKYWMPLPPLPSMQVKNKTIR